MKPYEFFDHTADAKFRAYGKSMDEAFANAALATTSVMFDPVKVDQKVNKSIKIHADDLQSLLVKFLGEFVYLHDAESFILSKIISITINKTKEGYSLAAVARGDTYSEKYEILGDVKAVTYNSMEIGQDKNFFVQVVLDI